MQQCDKNPFISKEYFLKIIFSWVTICHNHLGANLYFPLSLSRYGGYDVWQPFYDVVYWMLVHYSFIQLCGRIQKHFLSNAFNEVMPKFDLTAQHMSYLKFCTFFPCMLNMTSPKFVENKYFFITTQWACLVDPHICFHFPYINHNNLIPNRPYEPNYFFTMLLTPSINPP